VIAEQGAAGLVAAALENAALLADCSTDVPAIVELARAAKAHAPASPVLEHLLALTPTTCARRFSPTIDARRELRSIARVMTRMVALLLPTLAALLAACPEAAPKKYTYVPPKPLAPEAPLPKVQAEVVSDDRAAKSGLASEPFEIQFSQNQDGGELVGEYFRQADAKRARYITNLGIQIEWNRAGLRIACRSEVVPEAVTEPVWITGRHKSVSVSRPVTRTVTENHMACKPVMRSEMRSRTEYEQKCGSVSKPVTRTRTVYRSQYDYSSKSTRSVPTTETYTEYQSSYECKSQPITRTRSEMVTKNECKSEPVTRQVTRYEYQLESRYIPAHFENITRQRLRELDPVCFELGPDEPSGNRIEGRIFVER
jgi:hypothetical protein